jgi:hypothetical protein
VNRQPCLAIRPLSASLMLALVMSMLVTAVLPSGLVVRAASVEPGDVTLTLDDLPPGFAPNPRFTKDGFTDGVGPSHQVQFEREPSAANLSDGPVVVGQNVLRLDTSIGAGDALVSVREFYVEQQGFDVSDVGPNDGGTFTLKKTDSGVDFIMIGFIKQNWIFVTLAAGLPGVVSYEGVLQLAGISSARLDAKLGH